MSKRKKAPSGPSAWEDDDARTVFDDAILHQNQQSPKPNPRTTLKDHPPRGPRARPSEKDPYRADDLLDEGDTVRRIFSEPRQRESSTDASRLPELGSLTAAWRDDLPATDIAPHPLGLTTPDQPGVLALTNVDISPHKKPQTNVSPRQTYQQTEPLVPSAPDEQNDFSRTVHRSSPPQAARPTMPFGEDAVTGFLTPEDMVEAEDDLLEEEHRDSYDSRHARSIHEHHKIHRAPDSYEQLANPTPQRAEELELEADDLDASEPLFEDENPTSPGGAPKAPSNRFTDEFTSQQPLPATPIKGLASAQQQSPQTSSYSSANVVFPGEEDVDESTRYTLQGPLAKGGMSLISKAFDNRLLRDNAMKILDGKLASDRQQVRRFLEEAQITGQLGHPNIVPVHDIGKGNAGQYFFTMKLIRGDTLKEHLQKSDFSPDNEAALYDAIQILLRVCDAVAYAHSRGVIHRDLKPSNIMVGSHGQVYLMDWGIAYILPHHPAPSDDDPNAEGPIALRRDPTLSPAEIEGDILGTWNYMAPEQAQGRTDAIGVHTDIFALGAILYEMLTDSPPYHQESIYAILQSAQNCDYLPPQELVPHIHLPPELCHIATQAMHPEPEQRYASVEDLKQDLERFLRGGEQFPQRRVPAGTLIIREGDVGEEAYIISRGHCRVFKTVEGQKLPLRDMMPGEVFGETSIFLDQRRTASVEAIDDVTLIVINRDALEQKLQRDTWLGRFVHTLANRFVDVDQKATQLQQQLRRERIINYLLTHLQSHGIPTSRGPTASWDTLSENACRNLQLHYDDLLRVVQQLPQFYLDLEQNQIYLRS